MTLYELCKQNPKGFTWDLKHEKPAKHKKGYYIAITDNPIHERNLKAECDSFIKAFYYFSMICRKDVYIGGWQDNKIFYLDYTIHCDSKNEALKLAETFKQRFIWDCKNQLSIPV